MEVGIKWRGCDPVASSRASTVQVVEKSRKPDQHRSGQFQIKHSVACVGVSNTGSLVYPFDALAYPWVIHIANSHGVRVVDATRLSLTSVSDLYLIPTVALSHIQRLVGTGNRCIWELTWLIDRGANTHSERNLFITNLEGGRFKSDAKALHDFFHCCMGFVLCQRGLVQIKKNSEFFSPESPERRIYIQKHLGGMLNDMPNRGISSGMTVSVVNILEVVYIKHCNTKSSGGVGRINSCLKSFVPGPTV